MIQHNSLTQTGNTSSRHSMLTLIAMAVAYLAIALVPSNAFAQSAADKEGAKQQVQPFTRR